MIQKRCINGYIPNQRELPFEWVLLRTKFPTLRVTQLMKFPPPGHWPHPCQTLFFLLPPPSQFGEQAKNTLHGGPDPKPQGQEVAQWAVQVFPKRSCTRRASNAQRHMEVTVSHAVHPTAPQGNVLPPHPHFELSQNCPGLSTALLINTHIRSHQDALSRWLNK